MSTEVKETIREKIARQIAEEEKKSAERRAENQKKLEAADDKTIERCNKLIEKANKKAELYLETKAKLPKIEEDYNTVSAEVEKYRNEVFALGREEELGLVESIYEVAQEI